MKKLIIALLLLSVSGVFAVPKNLTVGETLTLYFNEIFPDESEEINDIMVNYGDIGSRTGLRSALQRGIYYGMLPNTSAHLKPDTIMTDRAFALLLKRHFGVKVSSDLSPLTTEDYEKYMTDIRISYVYSFLQAINQNTLATVLQPALPMPRIAEAEKYHILDDVYSIIRQNHLNTATITDKDLLYGAAEGMTDAAGDPYTKFFRPDASTDFHQSLEGKIAGIGVVIDIDAT